MVFEVVWSEAETMRGIGLRLIATEAVGANGDARTDGDSAMGLIRTAR